MGAWIFRSSRWVWWMSAFVVAAGFVLAFQFVKPAPPNHVTMAAGAVGGSSYQFAQRYQKILAQQKVHVDIIATTGSLACLEMLQSGAADIAITQSGTVDPSAMPELTSLGCLYYEPLWIITQGYVKVGRLSEFAGRTLAVGPQGSGTHILTLTLLQENGVTPTNTKFLALEQADAVQALFEKKVDAIFWVTGIDSKTLGDLDDEPETPTLFSMRRWRSYTMRYNYLKHLVLPEGGLNLQRNFPKKPVDMISTMAELVAGPNFSPALVDLFLQAAEEIHDRGGWLEKPGEFPRAEGATFPVPRQVKRFFKSGPPFLQRYLPFWVANYINRMVIMLLPLATLLFPLLKVAPPMYRWQVRRRIYRRYRKLRRIDMRLQTANAAEVLTALQRELNDLEKGVSSLSVPLSFTDLQYELRWHISIIRSEIEKRLLQAPQADSKEAQPLRTEAEAGDRS
ncbi:MAG: TAXI family TRAP transporter solute-binding subunit [Desulfovibrionaceae bacterium]